MQHHHDQGRLIEPGALVRPARTRDVDVLGLARDLRRAIAGEVRFDAGARALYATDASNYRQAPIGVCLPKSKDDVVAIFAVARRYGAPLVSRAGGTALAGQTCNHAILIDWSKYMNRIVSIDPVGRQARVQPGLVCDHLAHAAERLGLTYGPKPATHDHCCFGGMLGNNSCGIHAQMAGKAVDNTEAMEVLLYDGTRLNLGWMTDAEFRAAAQRPSREGRIYAALLRLRRRYEKPIVERYPKIPRRVSGYNLDELLPGPDGRVNMARLLVGSEGTLAAMLEMTVRLVPNPPRRALVILGYPDIYRAADHVPDIVGFGPIGLEGIDGRLRDHIERKHLASRKYLQLLPTGQGWLFVEFGGETEEEARAKADRLVEALESGPEPPSISLVVDEKAQRHLWDVREAGLGATAFVPGQPDTWPGFEDSAVAPENLGAYLRDLRLLFERFEYQPSVYGHFGMGCVHCRIDFDMETAPGVAKYRRFMDAATDLVVRYGGSISGEHGDGQARAEFLSKMFGADLVRAMGELKAIFDPDHAMNPGKVVDPFATDENLRLRDAPLAFRPDTYFHYPEDGGSFAHATMRCVGIGKCRRLEASKEGDDTMCPSFMVTREEMHSTRGRAHLLFEMLREGPLSEARRGWDDEHVKESLDLCLACKGCKGDCPVSVDMATYKAEFLAHYYQHHRRPRAAWAFGFIDRWARLASLAPGLANLVTQTPVLRRAAKWLAGVSRHRPIPRFAPTTFRRWFLRHAPKHPEGPEVVLWADTFNNHFRPETARAAVEVLEDAGFRISVPAGHVCCGRPLYDYGFLDEARRYLERVLDALSREIAHRIPVVVLEPSCASVFRDELPNLFPDRGDARILSQLTHTLGEFLCSPHASGYRPPLLAGKAAIVQGHCHHKAVLSFDADRKVMEKTQLNAQVLTGGCCGMAGAFGYEEGEKYRVSIAAGERALLPAVRRAADDTIVVADGFSCKEQIAQTTPRQALHLAELLALGLRGSPTEPYPEHRWLGGRLAAERRSMARAAIAVGIVFAGIALGLHVRS